MADADTIDVVAAVVKQDGRYLLGRRPADKRHGGLWEFPGGKIQEGETLLQAADRELQEELGLDAQEAGDRLFTAQDPGSAFVIHFVEITAAGEPNPTEHSEVGWFTPSDLAGMALAPSDAAFVSWLAATG